MATTATVPKANNLLHGGVVCRVQSVNDNDTVPLSAVNVRSLYGPLYVKLPDANGASAFIVSAGDGTILMRVGSDGLVQIGGIMLPEDITGTGDGFYIRDTDGNYVMRLDLAGNLISPMGAYIEGMASSISLVEIAGGIDAFPVNPITRVIGPSPHVHVVGPGIGATPPLQVVQNDGTTCCFKVDQSGNIFALSGIVSGVSTFRNIVRGGIRI